jgi:hypothetical protein
MRAGSHRIYSYSCSSAIAPDVYRDLMGQHWENINTQEIRKLYQERDRDRNRFSFMSAAVMASYRENDESQQKEKENENNI